MGNAVNHPDHYQLGNGMEVVDVISIGTKGIDGEESYQLGNAIKYIFRYRKKHKDLELQKEDLGKAVWSLQRIMYLIDLEIEREEALKKAMVPAYPMGPVSQQYNPAQ